MTNIQIAAFIHLVTLARKEGDEHGIKGQELDDYLDNNVKAISDALHEYMRIRDFVKDLADEDCSYGDNCPSSARHYRCLRCKAKRVLE